jgi:DNA-binding MarR family transcriptional regulator
MAADAFDFRACQQCVCSAMRKASRAITHHYDAELRGSGLRVTQFTLLATLAQTGPMPFLGLERTTLTRNLKPLLRDKLVEPRDEKDARIRRIAITSRGEAAARAAFPLWKKAQDSVKKLTAPFDIRLSDTR